MNLKIGTKRYAGFGVVVDRMTIAGVFAKVRFVGGRQMRTGLGEPSAWVDRAGECG